MSYTMSISKKNCRSLLNHIGLLNRLRASKLYDIYWQMFDRKMVEARRSEAEFYRNLLNPLQPDDLIFDIGANKGGKTSCFLSLGTRVVAVDPDDENVRILKEKFIKFRFKKPRVVILACAVSDRSGVQTMWLDSPGCALNSLCEKWVSMHRTDSNRFKTLSFGTTKYVRTTTLDDLIITHGLPVFVKIDVEGHEPAVLSGLHRLVPCLSFEVHLPEFRREALECISLLNALAPSGLFNYVVNLRRSGWVLPNWVGTSEFKEIFIESAVPCAEVFWKATPS
jgi:FkbM family methyltransferase